MSFDDAIEAALVAPERVNDGQIASIAGSAEAELGGGRDASEIASAVLTLVEALLDAGCWQTACRLCEVGASRLAVSAEGVDQLTDLRVEALIGRAQTSGQPADATAAAEALEARLSERRAHGADTADGYEILARLFDIAEDPDAADEARRAAASRAISERSGRAAAPIDAIGAERQAETTRASTRPNMSEDHSLVSVFYATNRTRSGAVSPARFYGGGARDRDLEYGRTEVSVPRAYERPGELASPRIWRGEFYPDPARHIILRKIQPLGEGAAGRGAFLAEARSAMKGAVGREILVFVHGYNTSFTSAVSRCAQLAVDLEVSGLPVVFSWPSRGALGGYMADESAVSYGAVRALADFLRDLATECDASIVHLIAHSMGNRLALMALQELARPRQSGSNEPVLAEFVAASPDVGRDDFLARFEEAKAAISGATLYASRRDRALGLSQWLHAAHRAGQGLGDGGADGVDLVDTSDVCGDLLGHSDFAGSALDDLRAAIWHGLPARARRWLEAREGAGWRLKPPEELDVLAGLFARAVRAARLSSLYGAQDGTAAAVRQELSAGPGGEYLAMIERIIAAPRKERRR